MQSSSARILLSAKVIRALVTTVPPSSPLLQLLTSVHTPAEEANTASTTLPTMFLASASQALLSAALHGLSLKSAKACPAMEEILQTVSALFRLARNRYASSENSARSSESVSDMKSDSLTKEASHLGSMCWHASSETRFWLPSLLYARDGPSGQMRTAICACVTNPLSRESLIGTWENS